MASQLEDVVATVREQMSKGYKAAKDNETIGKYLTQLEELLESTQEYQDRAQKQIQAILKQIAKALGPDTINSMGLSSILDASPEEEDEDDDDDE